ncbi:MAG TPA: hypothetical protein VGO96_01765 [Pyrinomonadaceae bacterium]|jgi:hypothetical protein|nr:hypothetical protein [Pyrinomonadaceae bacterium]
MKNFSPRLARLFALLLFALVSISLQQPAHAAHAQRREHLTEQEVEMVRDTQELDRRAELFIKIAERRLLVVTGAPEASSPSAKDLEKWGAVPKGSRSALFNDLARIFDEAINNVDDVAARTPDSPLIPKAVRKLEAAATRFLPQLTALRQSTNAADGERESLEQAIDNLQQIVEAAKRLPEETPEEKKGDKKKKN